MNISREETIIWRGLAIIGIVVHNILVGGFGFVSCNEMTFQPYKTEEFLVNLYHPDNMLVGNFFAFLGWIGVPVFVFLSGYGLQKKYGDEKVDASFYLRYNYLKLFLLLLPAVLFYVITFALSKDWTSVISNLLSLTLFGNLWHFVIHLNPSVYWYFGLTWELYLFFFLMNLYGQTCKTKPNLILGGAFFLLIQVVVYILAPDNTVIMEWLRRNIVGWLPVFLLGIMVAKSDKGVDHYSANGLLIAIFALITLFIICVMNANFYSWLFIPFFALLFFVLVSNSISRIKFLKFIIIWIGSYSSTIFVTQTIARGFARRLFENTSILLMVVVYLLFTFVMAMGYQVVYGKLKKKMKLT